MNRDQDKTGTNINNASHIQKKNQEQEKLGEIQNIETDQSDDKDSFQADALYRFLKPLHNLPRGKNAWNPKILQKRWFWPLSALFLIILFYIYPYIWDFFAG